MLTARATTPTGCLTAAVTAKAQQTTPRRWRRPYRSQRKLSPEARRCPAVAVILRTRGNWRSLVVEKRDGREAAGDVAGDGKAGASQHWHTSRGVNAVQWMATGVEKGD